MAVFAVLGLYTSVLMSSNEAGADPEAIRASFQVAGEVVSACETVAVGFMESAASFSVRDAMVWYDERKREVDGECDSDSTRADLLTLIDTIRSPLLCPPSSPTRDIRVSLPACRPMSIESPVQSWLRSVTRSAVG